MPSADGGARRGRPAVVGLSIAVVILSTTLAGILLVRSQVQEHGADSLIAGFPVAIALTGVFGAFISLLSLWKLGKQREEALVLVDQMTAQLRKHSEELAAKNRVLTQEVGHQGAEIKKDVSAAEEAKVAMLNVLEDLTVAKGQLEATQAYDEALVASMADGVIAVDPSGRVAAINDAAIRLLGLRREDVVGKDVESAIPLLDDQGNPVPREKQPLFRSLMTKRYAVIAESNYYHIRSGVRFPVAIEAAPIMLGGNPNGAIAVFRDVTLEKEIDKTKTELISLASHQLRTPLTAISWYLELLSAEGLSALSDDQRSYVKEVQEATRRMIDLVDALLNVSRVELGTIGGAPHSTLLVPLTESLVEDFRAVAEKKNIGLHHEHADRGATIDADSRQIGIIVQNLVSNAVRYTREGGSVTIRTRTTPQSVMFEVADTGIGISAHDQAHIFTKLYRADNARLMEPEGSGLGLYMVKTIVTRLGGTIAVVSQEGSGTTFTVTIPIGTNKLSP